MDEMRGLQVVCSVFDVKAEGFMQPMFFQARGQAMRSFQDAVNDADSVFFKHPEDYTLFQVAYWNPQVGELVLLEAHDPICKGVDVKEVVS